MSTQIKLPAGVPALTQYYFYLTAGCNLACRHCWLAPKYQPDGGTGGHLDFELFKMAIDEGQPLGLQSVKLTGGEPLLHPDFIRIIELLYDKGLPFIIESNGTLMTRELAQHLMEHKLDHISFSLDGATAASHDSFRGVLGSFEKTCNAVEYMVEVGFHPQVIMSVHSGNVDEIEPLVRLAEKMKAGSVKFNLVQPTGRGETMTKRNQVLDIKGLIEIGKWVEKDLQKRTSIPLIYSWPMAFFSLRRLLETTSSSTCGILNILGILATGQLAMCGIGMDVPELVYGKLGVDKVANVWYDNQILKTLRKEFPAKLEGVCNYCFFKDQCRGCCVAENYYQSHSVTAPYWFCQQAFDSGLMNVNRLKHPN